MSAISWRLVGGLWLAAFAFSSASAVGLGPLAHSGVTRTERKGFYLTLINPYPTQERFRLYSVEWDSEAAVDRVVIPVNSPTLGPMAQRRLLVVDTRLTPGEVHRFRVCAERIGAPQEDIIHARVCSRLTARRVA